ncbi:MAG: dehydrogenase [Planctomycetes bacterium]|jgi:predicted dehydrogenase|nr:dehydrogenase [Planctomycetota bacterium]HJO25912.1 Gfo/Idh/MocA family oxidoreductase [Planctomycetota bacterium]
MKHRPSPSRRSFLAGSGAALAGGATAGLAPGCKNVTGALALDLAVPRSMDTLRVALIGCGGRGTGAANQALSTSGSVELVAMADAFADRLAGSRRALLERHPEAVRVPDEQCFVGFDAYQRAMELDVDVVILATPPGFRPLHFEHAVALGRHVFMEKPVAVDGPGVRRVLAAAEAAKAKNLKVGVGLQRHHDVGYIETVRRIQAGQIGRLQLLRVYWNSAGVWVKPRREGMSEMQYQMRNWYYFNWLCGDHIVEQHIHNLDVGNWIMGGPPVAAQGQGGRLVRRGPEHGEIFDHHMIEYTYAGGTKMLSQCRHMPDTWTQVSEHAHGTLGTSHLGAASMQTEAGSWTFEAERPDPYQREHDNLFSAIRADTPYNEAQRGAEATLTAIMGRMATYSGKIVKWEEALNSEIDLSPEAYAWDATPQVRPGPDGSYPVAVPGVSTVF